MKNFHYLNIHSQNTTFVLCCPFSALTCTMICASWPYLRLRMCHKVLCHWSQGKAGALDRATWDGVIYGNLD